ncbi:hypothetical protein ACFFRR_006254 [Megaselia abdita]
MPIPKLTESWEDINKGIGKKTVTFDSTRLINPTEVSKVKVIISKISNLENRHSQYLETVDQEFIIQMGSAVSPIDYYIETLLLHIKKDELCECFIKTSAAKITFHLEILDIEDVRSLFSLKLKDIFELAQKYKANGVEIYKKYPKFSEDYFCRAAKILISCKPFDQLTEKDDGVDGTELKTFLQNLYNNIAACKIREGKFDDVLFLTESVEYSVKEASEKAVYRRALALCNLQKYEEGKKLLDTYGTRNSEMEKLYKKIQSEWKVSEEKYASLVRKMFVPVTK